MPVPVPDELAARVVAAAAARGESVEVFVVEALEASPLLAGVPGPAVAVVEADALDGFFGCGDSGDPDWAGRDTAELRREVLARRSG